jgi:hypothetical protein
MPDRDDTVADRHARWSALIDAVQTRGFTAPGLAAEIVLGDIADRHGPLVALDRLDRAAARRAVRDRRVVGFRQERNMGCGDVFVVDVSRSRGAEIAYVLPQPLRIDDVADVLAANPWESLADMVAWFDDHGVIARAGDTAR